MVNAINTALIGRLPLGSERGVLVRAICETGMFARAVQLGVRVEAFSGSRSKIWRTVERHHEAHPEHPIGYRALVELLPELSDEIDTIIGSIDHAADFEGMASVLVDLALENERI